MAKAPAKKPARSRTKAGTSSRRFRVLRGCSYPPHSDVVIPAGTVVNDVPAHLTTSWIDRGIIAPVED